MPSPASPLRHQRQRSVLVVGAGVAGLTVAHECAERGYAVTVVEAGAEPGGKSRSMDIPGTARGGRRPLPGEHGFRFFPGFYRHVPDTMRRIPFRDHPDGVLSNLVVAPHTEGLTAGRGSFVAPNCMPTTLDDMAVFVEWLYQVLVRSRVEMPQGDLHFYIGRVLTALTACDERRDTEYERLPFWEFAGAGQRSAEYQRYCVDGLTRTLVACQAREISTRTWSIVGAQMLYDAFRSASDRVLRGPTSDVWFGPWVAHLERLGVTFRYGARASALVTEGNRIVALATSGPRGPDRLVADHVVLAVPVEKVIDLVTAKIADQDPALAGLSRLRTAWMAGVVLFLDRALPLIHGHTAYLDSPWALTSVAHEQFWSSVDLRDYGDGRVRGVLSLCISDWDRPGILYGLPARRCSREQIQKEVLAQLREHLNPAQRAALTEAEVLHFFVDPALTPGPDGSWRNETPLLINTVGSWQYRPEASTQFENLFLAGDYVRTRIDLACMEGANESARRAVNALLLRDGASASPCTLFPLEEPSWVAPLKAMDRLRYQRSLPHLAATVEGLVSNAARLLRPLAGRLESALSRDRLR